MVRGLGPGPLGPSKSGFRSSFTMSPHYLVKLEAKQNNALCRTGCYGPGWISSSSSRAGPYWSIAASTVCRHCSRSCARLHAAFRPMLSALRSFSTVHIRVHLDQPGGRLQWLYAALSCGPTSCLIQQHAQTAVDVYHAELWRSVSGWFSSTPWH